MDSNKIKEDDKSETEQKYEVIWKVKPLSDCWKHNMYIVCGIPEIPYTKEFVLSSLYCIPEKTC